LYLLDTTVWIDLLRTNSPSIRRQLSAHSASVIGLSIISVCELWYGLEPRATQYPQLRTREQQLLAAILAPFQVFHCIIRGDLRKDAHCTGEEGQGNWRP
jgi:predicted nucleic acid-binding protein